ncbi:class I SAM-dependent methyltransferase [Herbiconiux daphne]|uniref:Class I SAM-dependent methyltransferase n=1 Tax=Herbiconiux daphne TaxID=2970914 RepID=A0ABT2GZQ2_9MICO|nr:class I SAM-dependent methyltransferase [Herbiconiux daphne]MCS5733442.1 class I SAM-dependent methyltransferase [Herbiconiux daphne]
MDAVTAAYSRRAADYIELLGSMESVHPADLRLIDGWLQTVDGPLLDAGCGPGHWTSHLAEAGFDVEGIDRVPSFVDRASSSYPGVPFALGSIDAIDRPDASFGGVLSWFSTIHHTPGPIQVPLAEFARVLRPDGGLVLGYFVADAVERFDHAVTPAYRWPASELRALLHANGFEVVDETARAEEGQRPVGAMVCRRV